jgi:DNA primase
VSEIEFRLYKAAEGLDLETNSGMAEYLNRVAAELALINDPIAVDLYAGKLSLKYSVTKQTILNRISELKRKKYKAEQKKEITNIIRPKFKTNDVNPDRQKFVRGVKAEEEILAVLMVHPDLFGKLRTFSENDFISALNARVFSALKECFEKGQRFDVSLFGDEFSPEQIGYMVSLQNREIPFANPILSLTEAISTLREEKAKKESTASNNTAEDWEEQMKKIIENKRRNSDGN